MPRSSSPPLSRRDWLRLAAAGALGGSFSGWLPTLAADTAQHPQRRRACILLWMNGGPSQMDTFDLKPGHAHGGPYKEIETAVPGIKISEHLPKLAAHMKDMVLVRSMATKEGDHERATFHLRTGYLPEGSIQYPTMGSVVSKELGDEQAELPNFVSVGPSRAFNVSAYGPGFLGPQYAPLVVGDQTTLAAQPRDDYESALKVPDLLPQAELTDAQLTARIDILRSMDRDFAARHPGLPPRSHQAAYERAVRLMRTGAGLAFQLHEEPAALRDAYGRNLFGQGCLLARRLVERGVPFVEVTLGGINGGQFGWDTHNQNFEQVKLLSQVLDSAWATLLEDLRIRGLLESTLVVWMGEFGRTPQINNSRGRDHYPNAWTTVFSGGGVKGGQVVGKTSADGTAVEERPVSVADFLATICLALGLDPLKQNMSNVGRPIRLVDRNAKPIREVLS